MKIISICLLLIAILYLLNTSTAVAGLEQPTYELISKDGRFEIRHYQPVHVAQTTVQDSFSPALSIGFRRIANYIFGGNSDEQKIAMTAPVISTMPYKGSVDVLFVMPQSYSLQTLPRPNLSNIVLHKEDWSEVAVYRFGGWATEKRVIEMQKRLQSILHERGINTVGEWRVAQFNPPMIPPPFRKNELMVRIQK
jgi:hypothetical protein